MLRRIESPLRAFFSPQRIAIIGVSGDPAKMASRPLAYLNRSGYAGEIYPVNPKYAELFGHKCVREIESLPQDIDLALISLPAEAIPDAVSRCAARGVRVVTVLSGGFGEIGTEQGRNLEAQLLEIVERTGIRVCGPNCQGGINLFENVATTYSGALEAHSIRTGPIALVTQSGVFGGLVFSAAQDEGVGVGYWVSTGNELDLTFGDFLSYVAQDERIRVIGGYLESVKDGGEAFVASLQRARCAGKPVVLLKTGRTEAGQIAASSHTAAIAGSDEGYTAAFRRGGAVRVDTADEFREVVATFASGRFPRGNRVAVLSISGGAATLMADECSLRGLATPRFSDQLRTALALDVPSFGSVVNPVDLTGQLVADPILLEKTACKIAASGEADILAIFIGMCEHTQDQLIEVLGRLANVTSMPVVVTWVAGSPSVYPRIRELELPVFTDPSACIRAVSKMVEWVGLRIPTVERTVPCAGVPGLDQLGAGTVTEATTKRLLRQAGLPVPDGRLVHSALEAKAAVAALGGEVVMKLQAPSIPHKSDIGGVRIGVTIDTAQREFAALERLFPADAEGVLVENRIRDAVEFFIGVQRHPIFGPMVAVGLGGVFLEILRDVSIRLAPIDRDEALEMINELRGAPLLAGARGKPPRDTSALADLICRLSGLAVAESAALRELDLNPVFVRREGEGVVIGDALLVRG